MNEVARWITLQEPSFAVPLKGAVARIVKEFGLSPEEAGLLLEHGMESGAIAVQSADNGAVVRPSPRMMASQIDWATGYFTVSGYPLFMLTLHWPDVERVARSKATGATIEGRMELGRFAIPPPEESQITRQVYSDAAMSAWFVLREKTWPAHSPPPNESTDMDAAKQYFGSIPSRDVFRRIRQGKTSQEWRKTGPRRRH